MKKEDDKMDKFTKDELTLIAIYNTGSRLETINELQEMRVQLRKDEYELQELTDSAILKLITISDEEYDELDLFTDFDM